ncbi:MAG: hypothetical protein OXQ29_27905 [Rhodospirillaceae bacterium]|nr:hypothetical protein [Rhodospirillaceae bacterium]
MDKENATRRVVNLRKVAYCGESMQKQFPVGVELMQGLGVLPLCRPGLR